MSTTSNYNAFDPAQYYLRYNNLPDSTYYNYFFFNPFFDSAGLPIPAFWNWSNAQYLEYWSAMFDSPLVRATLLFFISNTVISFLGCWYFLYTWLKNSGFEGFEYSQLAQNKDPDGITQKMEW